MDDTIAAISTAIGEAAIAIVRLSGAQALQVADAVFRCPQGKPSEFPTHTVHLGGIFRNGLRLDQVLLTVMRAPRTYTGEDIVEINCHGGPLLVRQILNLCAENGARLAQPGEFTKRAFLNGKIDLTQAEAVMDLITAKTELSQAAAMRGLEGQLTTRVNRIRDRLLSVLVQIEADIDFAEDGVVVQPMEILANKLQSILDEINKLLTTATEGRILRHGASIAIVGRPNAGKSSLLNRLLGHDRAIVTPTPGTTRDTLEEVANIRGVPVRLIDTAGLRKTTGTTEAISVARSHKTLMESDLALHIVDSSRQFSRVDGEIAVQCSSKPYVLAINKIDLCRRLVLPPSLGRVSISEVSALTGEGIETLKNNIVATLWSDIRCESDSDISVNDRHLIVLRSSVTYLKISIDSICTCHSSEIIAHNIRGCIAAIGEITGESTTADLLDRVFSSFCVGK